MSLGEDKAIAAQRVGIGYVQFHGVEERGGDKLCGGKAGGGVPGTGGRRRTQRMDAKQASFLAKLFEQRRSGRSLSGCGHGASSVAQGEIGGAQRHNSHSTE